jgi:predicted N-acetyltransferase YhbS
MAAELHLLREADSHRALADGLVARAFGPGRYAKAAERLRENSTPLAELCFLAWRGERAVGCVRLWPIAIGDAPALLLGPIAVESGERSEGIGAALIRTACDAARAQGHPRIVLVGDEAYFGRFGFRRLTDVDLPGPVDRDRVLGLALREGAFEGVGGPVLAAPSQTSPRALRLAAE